MSFQLAPKTFWLAELISQFFCYSNSSKNITCPSGKWKTEFTSLLTKSTSPRLSDTTFFAHCSETKDDAIQICTKILYVLYFLYCHFILITYYKTGRNEVTWSFYQKWLKWLTVPSRKYLWNPDYSLQKTTTTNLSCDFPKNEYV